MSIARCTLPFFSPPRSISNVQTIEEIRRARLKMLEAECGSVNELASRIGKSPAQVSQWKNASISARGRERGMSSDTTREIEDKWPKPRGWMDAAVRYTASDAGDPIAQVITLMEEMPEYTAQTVVRVVQSLAADPDKKD